MNDITFAAGLFDALFLAALLITTVLATAGPVSRHFGPQVACTPGRWRSG